jgi:TolB-like protein/Tfp pilus assembly protein PilF
MTGEAQPKGSHGAPTTVFVSYSRDDQKRAIPIIQAIEQAGYSVWWDGLLEGGERFSRTTEAALETARAVVVLWSKTSTASHWVHDEATRGRDRRCLVPLSIDGSDPPLGFRQFQTIDVSHAKFRPSDPVVERVIRAVAALHDETVSPHSVPPQARGIDRRLVLGGSAALVAVGAGAAWWTGLIGSGGAKANSVAVLPFINLSGDPQQVYFSDGLAAEVRGELARNPLLLVIAQASSNTFRDRGDDAKAIARKLGVSYLLDGNVRRSGETVRVSAELIDGRSGFSQWSQSFDRPLADVFAVQDEIAGAVSEALTTKMAEKDGRAAKPGSTKNVAAYDAYLRGKDLFDQAASEDTDRAALAKFDEAIAADPQYGAAHAARSRTLTVLANQSRETAPRFAFYAGAVDSAKTAIRLSPDLADAHSALGFVLFNGKVDARSARAPYDRSFALGKGDADVLSRYALFCARTGRFEEARDVIAKATTLDPLNARAYRLAGEIEYVARNYAASIPPVERALALNPKMSVAHSALGASQLMLGRIEDAKQSYASEPNSLLGLTGLAIIAAKQGDKSGAQAHFARLVAEHGDNSMYQRAQILAQWGQPAEALSTLAKARQVGDAGLVYLRNDPFLDPLRKDAEFSRLLKALGFD